MARRASASSASSAASPSARSAPPAAPAADAACPCGLGASYGACCGVFHQGRGTAPTAERLMRSRYSAFVVRDAAYLLRTWSAGTRPRSVVFDEELRWTGLEVLGSTGGTAFHDIGTVEFRARWRRHGRGGGQDGEHGEQYENSRFARENGVWVYVAETGG